MSNKEKSEFESIWDKGNSILYELCRENPRHDDLEMTVAKSWLIGRSYSVALERRYKSVSNGQITNIPKLYEAFHGLWQSSDLQSQLDREISKKSMASFENLEDFSETLKLHHDLTVSIRRFSGQGISFASKYLHFHAPKRFPIYDQISKVNLKNELEKANLDYTTRSNIDFNFDSIDDEYLVFCVNLLSLKKKLESKGNRSELLTFREIDTYLQRY
ncbi:hypothetical protein LPTSP4_09630 [Leptospira ryugenii]|uniref:Uncharacterized protein n=1 Tax=Leptospira ryugenii TaxID=1917863 RepID=A0A2P2DXY6_9LEPT|nr:hypothetical protein [Leptospira ryugenii]GBF49450.1 hypothetical protein LPTSP4_09630 [Leptospira ryugenii]